MVISCRRFGTTCRSHLRRWPLEDWTDRLSLNVSKKFPLLACVTTQKSAVLGELLFIVNCAIFGLNALSTIIAFLLFNFVVCSCNYTSSLMVHSSAVKTQSAVCSESYVHIQQTSRSHVPECSVPYLSSSFPPSTASPENPLLIFLLKSFLTFSSQKRHFGLLTVNISPLNCP
jgi:hypothetical protein